MANPRGTLESAAHFTRGGGAPTPDHDADYSTRKSRVEKEQSRLVEWAKENSKLGLGGRLPPVFAEGGEHRVYFQKHTQRYLKSTRLDRHFGYGIALGSHVHGATPSEYLDRLYLQNKIFNDDIRIERIIRNNNHPIIVSSQPAIKGSVAGQKDLDQLMRTKGYERFTEGAYYDEHEGLLIYDLFPRNAIYSADGTIYPIDPVIQRIDPEFAQFLRSEPYTINLPR